MTLGEKIRCARKCIGISQGQLADKMCVSRSAVAKWETDKGMPDVENLKQLSRLLRVSVDRLLDDEDGEPFLIREEYCLEALGSGCARVRKDRLMQEKFPDARIIALSGRPELDGAHTVSDRTRGILTVGPHGNTEYRKSLKDLEQTFYLVIRDGEQYFVTVTDQFLEVAPVGEKLTEKQFRLGSWNFIQREELGDPTV